MTLANGAFSTIGATERTLHKASQPSIIMHPDSAMPTGPRRTHTRRITSVAARSFMPVANNCLIFQLGVTDLAPSGRWTAMSSPVFTLQDASPREGFAVQTFVQATAAAVNPTVAGGTDGTPADRELDPRYRRGNRSVRRSRCGLPARLACAPAAGCSR